MELIKYIIYAINVKRECEGVYFPLQSGCRTEER